MDIINLIELLKPQGHLVTVKLVSENTILSSLGGFFIAILPAIISLVALWFSYKQFKENLRNQTSQFKESTNHQIKVAELHAKISTEIEIIKVRCDSIRHLSVDCMGLATDLQKLCASSHGLANSSNSEAKKTLDYMKKQTENANEQNKAFEKLFAAQTLLMTYLDVAEDSTFLTALTNLCSYEKLDKYTSREMGLVRGEFLAECRKYINSKDMEIAKMTHVTMQ